MWKMTTEWSVQKVKILQLVYGPPVKRVIFSLKCIDFSEYQVQTDWAWFQTTFAAPIYSGFTRWSELGVQNMRNL